MLSDPFMSGLTPVARGRRQPIIATNNSNVGLINGGDKHDPILHGGPCRLGDGGAAHAAAGTWPAHPVTIVVPYAPGGATDAVARLVGQRMAERLGQPFIVENKPGGSSNIGMQAVARAAADGYTLLLVANSIATNNSLFADLPFDGQRDFAPVGMIASAPLVVAVPAASPFKTLGELLARARARPGELTYASPGIGSSAHLAGESLKQVAGIEVLHVPYKGAAPALSDMLGGRISFMPLNTVESMSHIKGGKLRALAIARASRMDLLPDVPTAAEAGCPATRSRCGTDWPRPRPRRRRCWTG